MQRRRSPRERRLNSDHRAMQELERQSSIIAFESRGNPPEMYRLIFYGHGLWKPADSSDVLIRDTHEVTVTLTSAYPRSIPELAWQTPIFHPNISASGVVCLGGYGTHWVPSLMLDGLCNMLWDMIRYKNFDIESPYNREAAVWTKQQEFYRFPLDERPLKNQVQIEPVEPKTQVTGMDPSMMDNSNHAVEMSSSGSGQSNNSVQSFADTSADSVAKDAVVEDAMVPDVQFIDPVADPQISEEKNGDNDILFIE